MCIVKPLKFFMLVGDVGNQKSRDFRGEPAEVLSMMISMTLAK